MFHNIRHCRHILVLPPHTCVIILYWLPYSLDFHLHFSSLIDAAVAIACLRVCPLTAAPACYIGNSPSLSLNRATGTAGQGLSTGTAGWMDGGCKIQDSGSRNIVTSSYTLDGRQK